MLPLDMKYLKFLFIILFLLLVIQNSPPLTPNSYAHLPGQPPFFKVNGVLTGYYPVPVSSNPDFKLPQDIAPASYLVGETIEFEIDTNLLPTPKEVTEKTDFTWDFGDGESGTGIKNSHSYPKPGSYILEVKAKYNGDIVGEPQLIQSMLVNIIPAKDYQLPKSVFSVNGFQSNDPLTDALDARFNQEFKFDATLSQSSSPITEYIWDFGDGETASGSKVTHRYSTNPYTVFPVLRVKTADGYIADSFMQIKDESSFDTKTASSNLPKDNPLIYLYLMILAIGVGISVFIIVKKRKKKSR